jgi:hypothetical protein
MNLSLEEHKELKMVTQKLTSQQDALRNIIQTLTKLNKTTLGIDKAQMSCEISNGKTIVRIEVVSRNQNV